MSPGSSERGRGGLPALVVGLGGLLAGCDGGSRPVEQLVHGGYERIELSPVDSAEPAPERRVLARFEPWLEQHLWSAAKGALRFTGDSAEADSLASSMVLEGDFPCDLSVARSGELAPLDATEVQLWVVVPRPCRMVVAFLRDGESVATTDFADVLASDHPQLLTARLPRPFDAAATIDALEIRFQTTRSSVTVREVSIVAEPPSVKAAEQRREELVTARGEARRGWLVSPHRALVAEARAGAGARLRFSWAQTPDMRTRNPGGRLHVELAYPDGRTTARTIALETKPNEPPWREVELELGPEEDVRISMRFSLECSAGVDAACAVADVAVSKPRAQRPPSVLLVTSDTHRSDFIGAAARPADVLTPNLDRLAARGVTFQDCFASTNVTNPSHIALMTGESPRDTGVTDNRTRLSESAPTLAESFRDLGYRTWAAVSSRHLRHEVSGLGQGFDRVAVPFPADTRRAAETLSVLDAWLADAETGPVFLWVHLFDAHAPYDPPPEHAEPYWPSGRDPLDPSLPDPGLPESMLAPAKLQGLRDLDYPIAQYKGEVSYLDAQLGRLLDREPFAHGVIAFVADHGESFGEHRIYYGHSGLYPQTVQVPLILSWPGAPPGERRTDPVRQIDLARTLLDLVGAAPLAFPGQSLVGARSMGHGEAAGGGSPAARFALSAHRLDASVTFEGHHLVLHLQEHKESAELDKAEKHAFRLYDLERDPECRVDLAEREPHIARSLHTMLVEWLQSPKDLGWAGETSEDPGLLAALEQLGYAAGAEPATEELWSADGCDWCRKVR